MEALPGTIEMISGGGAYNAADVESFIGSHGEFSDKTTPFTVVSIIGPQSSDRISTGVAKRKAMRNTSTNILLYI
uniref:Uncharacterized protein n=1 Tax=Oryza meridionalis TaxID=40149 RepID=A0A0E0F2A4_9ORYZ